MFPALLLILPTFQLVDTHDAVDENRPATVWAHCELSLESPAGSRVLTRPILSCPVDNRKSIAIVDWTDSSKQQRIDARARNLDGTSVEIDVTLTSKEQSTNAFGKRTALTRSVRVQDTVEMDTPFEVTLFNDADRERSNKLIVNVRMTNER